MAILSCQERHRAAEEYTLSSVVKDSIETKPDFLQSTCKIERLIYSFLLKNISLVRQYGKLNSMILFINETRNGMPIPWNKIRTTTPFHVTDTPLKSTFLFNIWMDYFCISKF